MDALRRGLGISDAQKPASCRLSEMKNLGFSIDNAYIIKYEFDSRLRTQMNMLLNFSNCLQASLFPDVNGVAQEIAQSLRRSLQYDVCVSNLKGGPIYASCTAMLLDGENHKGDVKPRCDG